MHIGKFINKDCKVETHLIKILKEDAKGNIYGDIVYVDAKGCVKRIFVVLKPSDDYWQEARIVDMI